MCQLLLVLDKENAESIMKKFLSLSSSTNLKYGHGIQYIANTNRYWSAYKNTLPPHLDETHMQLPITNNVIAHLREIYTKTLSSREINAELTIHNTQPYQYNDMYFIHHGDWFRTDTNKKQIFQRYHKHTNFIEPIVSIRNMMNSQISKNIKGTTDSELMFHLFVQFLTDKQMSIRNYRDHIAKAWNKTITTIAQCGFQNSSNVVFTHGNYVMFSNIYQNRSSLDIKQTSLYVNYQDGVTVCSSRIVPNMTPVSKNKIYIYNRRSKYLSEHNVA